MSTLVVTTQSGVRPLGVRGEPLHNAAAQLRRVVRRRLGDDAAGLLADPQLHDDGKTIDWYAEWDGEVRPLETLAGFGVKEYRTWCPIDTVWPSEVIGTEQHGRADLGFSEAVSARRG